MRVQGEAQEIGWATLRVAEGNGAAYWSNETMRDILARSGTREIQIGRANLTGSDILGTAEGSASRISPEVGSTGQTSRWAT